MTPSQQELAEEVFRLYYATYDRKPGAPELPEGIVKFVEAAVDLAESVLGRTA